MDAYSYLFHGQVFANAQTGNMLLLGVNIAAGNFAIATNYIWPVLFFAIGIIIADIFNAVKKIKIIHWRQISVLLEAIILTAVAFMPELSDDVANALISFACGIQVQSFRAIRGNSITTTMCIGNFRSGTSNLDRFLFTKEKSYLRKSLLYYGIIVSFVAGAIIESVLIRILGRYAILFSSALLLIALCIMFYEGVDETEY
ncbi:hypothetical protein HMPREF0380_01477 [Eubacterium infirmum F0142]|nr:hypothetical protein HMPREF0380_01477 [Eubacterium infirmum F0142]